MIIESIFLSKLSPGLYSSFIKEESNPGPVWGFIIDNIDETFFNFFYQISFFKTEMPFCFAAPLHLLNQHFDDKTNSLLESLGPLFFNRNYFTINGCPLFIVLSSSQKEINANVTEKEILSPTTRMFTLLGYEKFYYCFINEKCGEIIYTNIPASLYIYDQDLTNSEDNLKNWYLEFLENNIVSRKFVFFFIPSVRQVANTYAILKYTESEFEEKNPLFFALLEEKINLVKHIEQNEIKISRLQKEIESREVHISSLQNIPQSSFKKLNDFYYYEYEILPTWYKRFGHIIKVIMGKRTFRSLFDDNVKKYKD